MNSNRVRALGVPTILAALMAGSLTPATTSAATASTIDPHCRHGRVVCIDKTTQMLRWMINGRVELFMSARFGGPRNPTREGTFRIYWKLPHHISNLTGESMPYSMFFSRGEAVHYSSDFAGNGYAHSSSGCVQTRDYRTTQELFRATEAGDRVVVYRS